MPFVKGTKHSGICKVKTLKPVDEKHLKLLNDVAQQVTPQWRLNQMYDETFDTLNGGKGDIKKTGDFIRAVFKDIAKEELDILAKYELTIKDISGSVVKIIKPWFFTTVKEEIGL